MTDIEIAQNTKLLHIKDIAAKLNITEDNLEYYGKYKAKLSNTLWDEIKDKPNGKLILVTALTPTPAGEGKTTTTIGLVDAFNKLGLNTCGALREPSLGPTLGLKGGACGALYSQVAPMEDINLHFTGDIHAVTTTHNFIAAAIDNHIHQGNQLNIDIRKVLWKRVVDLNDRALRNVIVGLGGKSNGFPRETGFDITVASEIAAILCLSNDLTELKKRLKEILIAYDLNNNPIYLKQLNITDALALLLKDAIKPNIVQTLEHSPVLIHGFPFANIAHGCNSILATKYALKLSDIVVTEAGFGSDLGAEKFLNIKCRLNGLVPDCIAIVATIRALKMHGGVAKDQLKYVDTTAVNVGLANLEKHIENMQQFNIPVVVVLNKFNTDTDEEIFFVKTLCDNKKVPFAISTTASEGSNGGIAAAKTILNTFNSHPIQKINFTYDNDDSIKEKVYKIATKIYGATQVNFSKKALNQLKEINKQNLNHLPICIAKTQYSFSDNAALIGKPENFDIAVKDIKINTGAGFIVILLGDIMTMPGLPKQPAAENIRIFSDGTIYGLF